MAKFVKLHLTPDAPVYFNVDHISAVVLVIEGDHKGKTNIVCNMEATLVIDPIDEVMRMLGHGLN